jgi:hypothetical protein
MYDDEEWTAEEYAWASKSIDLDQRLNHIKSKKPSIAETRRLFEDIDAAVMQTEQYFKDKGC